MKREEIYKLIDGERDYQETKWPGHAHSPQEFLTYIVDYANEALHVGVRESDCICIPKQMESMRKIAALAVAAMEQHPAPPRMVF